MSFAQRIASEVPRGKLSPATRDMLDRELGKLPCEHVPVSMEGVAFRCCSKCGETI